MVTQTTHASHLPFAFSACYLIQFLFLISLISVHFHSITSFVFRPPRQFSMVIKRAVVFCTPCLSPRKQCLFFSTPLLTTSVLSSRLSTSDSIPLACYLPPFSLLQAFYLSLYHFRNLSSCLPSPLSPPILPLLNSLVVVSGLSQHLTLLPKFYFLPLHSFSPFNILSPSSLVSLPLPQET